MPQIVLKIPTGTTTWVQGECVITGYEGWLLVERVGYEIAVEAEIGSDGRRTVHIPALSDLTITRRLDIGSVDLTRYILNLRVGGYPWQLTFLRDIGGGLAQTQAGVAYQMQQVSYMTMTLQQPLLTSQAVSVGESEITETLKVSVSAISWQYTAFNAAQNPLGNVQFNFDVQAGTVS